MIELALPAELTHEQNIALARKFIKQTFVDQGMCADFALHDKGDGNPHVHILLTMRAINEDGTWAEKGRLVYNLDENGNRIQEVSGLMTIMKQRNITDAASLASAVTEENQRFYEFRSRRKQNQELSDEISVRIEAYNDYQAYAKIFKKWCKLSGPEKSAFERQHEFELHKYREADATLRRWQDDGEKIDINAWNEALKRLDVERIFLDREIDMRKETIRKLEVVKREFSKNRKEKNRNAPAGYPQQERSGRCTDYFLL